MTLGLDYSLDECPYCRKRLDSAPPADCPDPGGHRAERDEILPGPRLGCGCPTDSGCNGRHPGALGSASGYDER